MNKILEKEWLESALGDLKNIEHIIDDIISGSRAAIDRNYQSEVFNLGNHKSEKLLDMISLIEKQVGKKAIIDFQPIQLGDIKESFAEIDKSVEMLGYHPTNNVDVGIRKFVNWYKSYNR